MSHTLAHQGGSFLDAKPGSVLDANQHTIDNTTVYPREVVKEALTLNAAAVILAHNHPSGVAEPSDADRLITRRVRDALELLDVRLLDHLVVGGEEVVSLATRGLL